MRQLGQMLLFLALAGCSSSGDRFDQGKSTSAPLTNQVVPDVSQQADPTNSKLSPAAAAAAPTGVGQVQGQLMDCVTESCKINCSQKVAIRSRPKWCERFKEPI